MPVLDHATVLWLYILVQYPATYYINITRCRLALSCLSLEALSKHITMQPLSASMPRHILLCWQSEAAAGLADTLKPLTSYTIVY